MLGPIDYLAVERPESRVTGEGFRRLMDLVDRGVVRLLDILFIGKDPDGHVSKVEVADVEHSDALDERLWGLWSGLLDQSDIRPGRRGDRAGQPGRDPCVRERLAVPMWTAIDQSSARLVGAGRIVADDLVAALDALNPS